MANLPKVENGDDVDQRCLDTPNAGDVRLGLFRLKFYQVYIANLGDKRAIGSQHKEKEDHEVQVRGKYNTCVA